MSRIRLIKLAMLMVLVVGSLALSGTASAAAPATHPTSTATGAAAAQIAEIRAAIAASKAGKTVKPLAVPGQVCNTNSNTVIVYNPGAEYYYEVGPNTPIRIEAYEGPELYVGHAEGLPNGYLLRSHINQSTCHST
jgi:hypothetical protein